MKKLFKTVCVILSFCICVPLFTACAGKVTDATTNKLDYAKLTDTSNSVLPKPEYTLPALGSILETVAPGTTYDVTQDWTDNARYADEYSLELHDDGNWYHRDGTRVYPKANSPLKGKTIYWLGSSETLGVWTQTSTADALAALTDCKVVKNAFGGSTMLVDRAFDVGFGQSPDNSDQSSKQGRHLGEFNFCDRLNPDLGGTAYVGYKAESWSYTMFDKTADVDAFIVAVSTNDAANYYCGNNTSRWGTIKPGVWDKNKFDITTCIGAMEYIVAYIWDTWHCPIYFYTTPYFGSATTDQVDPSTGGVYKPHPFDANPLKLSYDPQGSTY
ncbi:MAG: hypothetical protein SPL13_00360, partial [Clostridia bacterium]|nr:hypothetical protein [Clostridia bacterium]